MKLSNFFHQCSLLVVRKGASLRVKKYMRIFCKKAQEQIRLKFTFGEFLLGCSGISDQCLGSAGTQVQYLAKELLHAVGTIKKKKKLLIDKSKWIWFQLHSFKSPQQEHQRESVLMYHLLSSHNFLSSQDEVNREESLWWLQLLHHARFLVVEM